MKINLSYFTNFEIFMGNIMYTLAWLVQNLHCDQAGQKACTLHFYFFHPPFKIFFGILANIRSVRCLQMSELGL